MCVCDAEKWSYHSDNSLRQVSYSKSIIESRQYSEWEGKVAELTSKVILSGSSALNLLYIHESLPLAGQRY